MFLLQFSNSCLQVKAHNASKSGHMNYGQQRESQVYNSKALRTLKDKNQKRGDKKSIRTRMQLGFHPERPSYCSLW